MASSHTEGVDVTAGISGAAKDDLLDGRPVPGLYVFIVFIVIIGAFSPLSFSPSFLILVGSLSLPPTGLSTCSERYARVARNGLDASSLHLYVVKSHLHLACTYFPEAFYFLSTSFPHSVEFATSPSL